MGVANSAAPKLAGITKDTPDPEGGVIDRKPGGKEPTGLLRDNAMSLVTQQRRRRPTTKLPRPFGPPRRKSLPLASPVCRTWTAAMSRRGKSCFAGISDMADDGKLTVRVDLRWPLSQWETLAQLGVEANFGDDWVRIGGVKGFVDGSLGSSTAKMFEPYL